MNELAMKLIITLVIGIWVGTIIANETDNF